MTYYPFSEGSIALAGQMMDNYYYIADGDQYPYSISANNGFTLASATYNIGASATAFNDVFCESLNIYDSVSSVDKSLWILVASQELTDTATSLEFSLTSGIDGDSCETYKIYCNFVTAKTDSTYLIFNGDSAANYGYQILVGEENVALTAERNNSTNAILVGNNVYDTQSSSKMAVDEITFYAKTGNERLAFLSFASGLESTWSVGADLVVYWLYEAAYIYDDATNTITTLKFYNNTGSFLTGTVVEIWGRK